MLKRPWSRPVRYAVAALIAGSGVLAAAVLLAVLPYGGELGQRITAGRPFTVTVPKSGVLVWAAADVPDLTAVRCDLQSSVAAWNQTWLWNEDITLHADGQRWRGVMMLNAEPAGDYTVVCTASGAAASAALSVGEPPRFRGPVAEVVTMLGAFQLAATGLLVGSVVALTGRRRRAATAQSS